MELFLLQEREFLEYNLIHHITSKTKSLILFVFIAQQAEKALLRKSLNLFGSLKN